MEEFLLRNAGSRPPVFIGRDSVIRDIMYRAAAMQDRDREFRKETRVIRGAPGAGKTSVLKEIEHRLDEVDPKGKFGFPRILILSGEMLRNMDNAMKAMTAAAGLDRPTLKKWLKERDIKTGISFFDAIGANVGIGGNSAVRRIPLDLHDMVNVLPGSIWPAPVIVAIDEAQRMEYGGDSVQADFIRALHNGTTDLPLLPVMSGLCDTGDRVRAMGLTRVENVHDIGCFDTDEAMDYAGRFCEGFGLYASGNGPATDDRLTGLVRDTEGWPRHLHHSFQTLGHETLLHDGDMARIRWDIVEREATDLRRRCNRNQQSPEMRESVYLTGAVMQDFRDGMRKSDIMALIRRLVSDVDGWNLPEGMSVLGFHNHLVHQGALQENPDHAYSCPIPTFLDHLKDCGEVEP